MGRVGKRILAGLLAAVAFCGCSQFSSTSTSAPADLDASIDASVADVTGVEASSVDAPPEDASVPANCAAPTLPPGAELIDDVPTGCGSSWVPYGNATFEPVDGRCGKVCRVCFAGQDKGGVLFEDVAAPSVEFSPGTYRLSLRVANVTASSARAAVVVYYSPTLGGDGGDAGGGSDRDNSLPTTPANGATVLLAGRKSPTGLRQYNARIELTGPGCADVDAWAFYRLPL